MPSSVRRSTRAAMTLAVHFGDRFQQAAAGSRFEF